VIRIGTISLIILLVVSQGISGVVVAQPRVTEPKEIDSAVEIESTHGQSGASSSQPDIESDLDGGGTVNDISEASASGQTVSISPGGDGEQTFVEGGVYTAIVTVDVAKKGLFDWATGSGSIENPELQLTLDTPSGDSGATIVDVSSSKLDYDENPCPETNQCTISSSESFAPGTTHQVRVKFYIDNVVSPDSVTLRADPTPNSDRGVAEATYEVTNSVDTELAMARAAEARAELAGGYNRTYAALFYYEDWEDRSERAMSRAFTIAANDVVKSAATGYADQALAGTRYANTLRTVQSAQSLYGQTTVGKIAEVNDKLARDLLNNRIPADIVGDDLPPRYNSSYALEELARLSRAEAEAWRAGNRERARELLREQLVVLGFGYGHSEGFEYNFEDDAPDLYTEDPSLYQQASAQRGEAKQQEQPDLVTYFDGLVSYSTSQRAYIKNTALPLTRNPNPRVSVDTSRTELRSQLKNLDPGEETTVTFTVSNGDKAGPTSEQGYLSISHSEALELTEYEQIGESDAAVSNYSAGGEPINYKNKQAPAEFPLTDIREFYDRGETNTYKITLKRTSIDEAWLTYREAFEPLVHNDSESATFARYPDANQIGTTDQQNFPAFNLSGQDEEVQNQPPIARISASSTTVTEGRSVTFDSAQSSDDEGITSRIWRIQNDEGIQTARGASTSQAFNSPGQYEVSLTVEDNDGETDTAILNVSVTPSPELTASFEANRTVIQPGDVTELRATANADQYSWDLDGDGNYDEASGREVTWNPTTGGDYTVSLKVIDGGRQDSASLRYTVEPAEQQLTDPTPVLDVPETLSVGEAGVFDASESTDQAVSDGELVSGSIKSYEWDFDSDGSTDATGASVSKAFDEAGSYTVNVTLADNAGYTVSTQFSVTVTTSDTGESSEFVDVDASDLPGSGTANDPYVITNASELQAMEDDLDAHYELGENIDASGTKEWNGGKGFDPVGERVQGGPLGDKFFSGSLNGNYYTITGLTINHPNENNVGLFGLSDGKVTNLSIKDADISGSAVVGGLVGFNSNARVNSASVEGEVRGDRDVGGLVGFSSGKVENSYANATVIASGDDVGGLVGSLNKGAVINSSYAAGDVTGSSHVGGILGFNEESTVKSSYAVGSVTGGGGLVGGEDDGPWYGDRDAEVKDSYWDIKATNQAGSAGGTGLRTSQMTGSAARTNMTGLDFDSVWQSQPGEYPMLTRQTRRGSNTAPVATFDYSPATPTGETTVTFDATNSTDSDGIIDSYRWDLDSDGLIDATGSTVSRTYDSPGSYDIRLILVDEDGATAIKTRTLQISSPEPASFTLDIERTNAPITAGESLNVVTKIKNTGQLSDTLDVSLSVPAIGSNSTSVSLDGGESATKSLRIDTEPSDTGTYTAQVAGASNRSETTRTVFIAPPEPASFTLDIERTNAPVAAGKSLNVVTKIRNTGQVGGTQNVSLSVPTIGSNTTSVSLGGGESTEKTLSVHLDTYDPGFYYIKVESEDDISRRDIRITRRESPSLVIPLFETETNSPIHEGESIRVKFVVSNSGASGTRPVTLEIPGLGQNTTEVTLDRDESKSKTLTIPTESGDAGSYDIKFVTETNNVSYQPGVTVLADDRSVLNASFVQPDSPAPRKEVQFNASASSPLNSIESYKWDFDGDGTIETTTSEPTVSHTYDTGGSYEPELIVVDDRGRRNATTRTLRVRASGPPTVNSSESMIKPSTTRTAEMLQYDITVVVNNVSDDSRGEVDVNFGELVLADRSDNSKASIRYQASNVTNGSLRVSKTISAVAPTDPGTYSINVTGIRMRNNGSVEDLVVDTQVGEIMVTQNARPTAALQTIQDGDQILDGARVEEEEQLELRADRSTDPNGDDLTYSWTQVRGPPAAIDPDFGGDEATVRLPAVDRNRTATFELAVSDGQLNDTERINITLTPTPDLSLDLSKSQPEYVLGSEVALTGPAPNAEAAALYVQSDETAAYRLVELDGRRVFELNGDTLENSSLPSDGVILPQGRLGGNALLTRYGVHDLAIVAAGDTGIADDGRPDRVLSANEISQATKTTTQIRVVPPQLNTTIQTINDEVAVEDSEFGINGTAYGNALVVVVLAGANGAVRVELIAVDDSGRIAEDDIAVFSRTGQFSTGPVDVYVLAPGRDGAFGDGQLPGGSGRIFDFERFIYNLDADSAAAVRTAIRNQTVNDDVPSGPRYPFPNNESDDLLKMGQFELTNASSTIDQVGPAGSNVTGVSSVPNGTTMVVRSTTNLAPEDNEIEVELRESNGSLVRSAEVETWPRSGAFETRFDTSSLPVGSYTLVVDDGTESTRTTVSVVSSVSSSQPPTARAGSNRTVNADTTVELDGTASNDPAGDTLRYQWQQIGGPPVSLNDPSAATSTFTAPSVGTATTFTFELTVTDSDGNTDTERVNVTVSPPATDTILVEPGSDGDYSSIDSAVENASAGATVEVRPGTYNETVDVTKSITLVAPEGAILDGRVSPDRTLPVAPNRSGAAIEIGDDASPTIEGFTVRNYDAAAIYAFGTTEDWTLRNVTIHDATIGVGASGSDGAWRLDGVRIRNVTSPIYADGTTGAFAIRDTVLRSNRIALVTTNATGDWTLHNATIRNTNGTAVYAVDTTGRWSIHESTLADNDRGINATGAAPAGNASRNWWGESSGPGGDFAGTGDTAVGNVTVNPYYADRALTTTAMVPTPSPGPANLTVAPPSLPANVTVDTTLSTSVTVTNVGGQNATQAVEFRLDVDQDGTLENTSLERQERINVSLTSGGQRSLQFETYTGGLSEGTYRYGIFTANDSQTGIVNVTQPPSAAATIQFDDATVVNGTRTVTVDRANYTGGEYYVVIHAEQSPGDGSVDLSTPLGNSSELSRGAHSDITVDLDPYAASGDDIDALTRDRSLVAVIHRTDSGANTFDGIVTSNETAVAASAMVDVRDVSQVTVGPPASTATFTSIDHAIDSVPEDGTVILRPGTYEQQLSVDRNVTLAAPDGATFDGRNIEETVTSGIIIGDDASPTISGVTVQSYDWGVSASDSTGDWTLRNVTVRNNSVGVQATDARGSWRIVDSEIRAHSNEGVQARETTGDWRIEQTQIRTTDDAGVDATRADGDWTVEDAAISESLGPAIEATRTDGDWLVRTSTLRNNTAGIDAADALGSWTVRNTQLRGNTLDGVAATATTGDWTVANATLTANYRGVNATRSTGAWTLTDSRLDNNTVAVDARGAVTAGSASKNWWGATDGPSGIFRGSGDAVRGNVLVRPFYTDAQQTTLSAPIRASVTFENTTVRPGTETVTVDRANYTGQPYVVVLYRDASPDDEQRNSSAVGVSSPLSTGAHADVPVDIGTTLSENDTLDRLDGNATLVARIHRTGGPNEAYGAPVPQGNATARVGVELPPATVSAGTATAISNTTVTVPVRARNATDVVAVGANVSYDPALANVTAVSGSGAEDSTVTINNETGTLRFEYRYAEHDTPAVNVTFDADTATGASTPITVANATVETAGPREPSVRTVDGRLTVLGSTVNVTNSTLNTTTVRPNGTVAVTATVTKPAPVAGQFEVPLRVNSSHVAVRNVTLASNETTTVQFTYTPTETGMTVISVGSGEPQTLTVDAIAINETSTTTTVEGQATPGTPLNASLAGTNGTTDAGVSLNRVNVSTTREADVSLEVNVSADSSEAPPLGDAAAYLNVSESVPEDAIGTVTFAFTVDTDRLSNPESAELYRYHDGTWNALDTAYLGEANGEYRFETTSPGLSIFAIRQSTSGIDTDGDNDLDTNSEPSSTPDSTAAPTTPSTPGPSTSAPTTATPPSTSGDAEGPETTPSVETQTAEPADMSPTSPTVDEPAGLGESPFVIVLVLLGAIIAAVTILRRREWL